MPHLTVAESARRDFDRLYEFIAEQSRTAAESLLDVFKAELLLLVAHPAMGRPVDADYREWKIRFGRSAYRVLYSFRDDEVRILRVEHSRERRI